MKDQPQQPYFRLPAEWEPHEATWLAWPHNRDDWPGKFEPIPWVFAEIVRILAASEKVHLIVADEEQQRQAQDCLNRAGADLNAVRWFFIPTNRAWLRDSGPIFLRDENEKLTIADWRFNAWAKYDDWQTDDAVPGQIHSALDMPIHQPQLNDQRIVLEGGSIDVNGHGLLLTTEECLLSDVQQRNPGLKRADLEQIFATWFGVKKTLWLNRGVAGDDTHGHIDDVARFVADRTVVLALEDDPKDKNYEPLQENLRRLQQMTDLSGRHFQIVTLPMPAPLFFEGRRLPASYANFYIANTVVLVPTYNDANDRLALNALAELFPKRRVVGVHAVDLVWGLGALHCLTQQQPITGKRGT